MAYALCSCHNIKQGKELSNSEKKYLQELGILRDDEKIILFDSQSDFNQSGNFFTDQRIASYWIDKRDSTKNSVDFALYTDIDTILTHDRSTAATYASYVEVVKSNKQSFNVYVDGDSAEIWIFFNQAIAAWGNKK